MKPLRGPCVKSQRNKPMASRDTRAQMPPGLVINRMALGSVLRDGTSLSLRITILSTSKLQTILVGKALVVVGDR